MIERELAAKRITELEAKLAEAGAQIRLLELDLRTAQQEYVTFARRNAFAAQVLSGEFDPPTIAEIRKARGLEPL